MKALPTSFCSRRHRGTLGSSRLSVVVSVAVFVSVLAASMLAAFAISILQPKTYRSTARIEVEQGRLFGRDSDAGRKFEADAIFLMTQIEIIRSRKILCEVIGRLNLHQRWAQQSGGHELTVEATFHRLKHNLAVHRYRDTNIIEISATDRDPFLASKIANETAERFELDRLIVMRMGIVRRLDGLRDAWMKQGERLKQARDKVAKLCKQLNIPVDTSPANTIFEGEAYRAWRDAQHELELEEQFSDQLHRRLQEEVIEIHPPPSPVVLIDQAEPVLVPVRPHVGRNLMLGAVVGVMIGSCLALLTRFALSRISSDRK
jgi:uncharacterized protein involved in exopolysaccharide biosynthesis